jgi:hypothetical protein
MPVGWLEMTDDRKLPQSRMYLKSAQWGFESLIEQKLSGYGFRFYAIGILAALRAVQHSLYSHDRNLSPEHERVIAKWWRKTADSKIIPDLHFIKNARDQILKAGSFESYAGHTESATGEGANRVVTRTDYDLTYYDQDGERHDLKAAIQSAIKWCEEELAAIEAEISQMR